MDDPVRRDSVTDWGSTVLSRARRQPKRVAYWSMGLFQVREFGLKD
ncbi:MAG: hypothetical protein WA639_00700 [Candidatus Acidiferrum sp.]